MTTTMTKDEISKVLRCEFKNYQSGWYYPVKLPLFLTHDDLEIWHDKRTYGDGSSKWFDCVYKWDIVKGGWTLRTEEHQDHCKNIMRLQQQLQKLDDNTRSAWATFFEGTIVGSIVVIIGHIIVKFIW